MKKLGMLLGVTLLSALLSGCVAPVGVGASYGVYGEYPTTYYGGYYSYPAYSYYRWAPYDRDHYWDREHYWDRHGYSHVYGRGRHQEQHH